MNVARDKLSVAELHAKTTAQAYWRPASERLRAVERCRQIAFGRENTRQKLQKVLEVAELAKA